MTGRTKRLFCVLCALSALCLSGCGYNEHTSFQNAFLPSTPHPQAEVASAPSVPSNSYLDDAPAVLMDAQLPAKTEPVVNQSWEATELIQRAEQAFQRGKKAYLVENADRARQEFDTAISLMLEASENHMGDRQAFERQLDRMVDAIHHYDLAGLGAGVDLEASAFEKAPLEDILQMTFPVDPRLKDKVKEQVQATASQLPLSNNDAVLSYINYFSGRGRKTLIAGLERAGRYRPMIERIFQEEGIPQELIHLAQAESGFFPRAVSSAAASGMWQFMAWRGREYGLMQTAYTDDRLDPEKATRASARHLHDLYNMFGDWYLAIAAYNCGPGVIQKAVERTGYADFFELRRRNVLPIETTNYVPIILAMTIMDKNAAEYGLDGITPDAPLEYDTLEVAAPTHLALVADLTGSSMAELLELNPALLKNVAPAGYAIHVPKGAGSSLSALLQMVPADRRASWRMHQVESGETLASIGRRYGMSAGSIASANGLTSDAPAAGDRLLIPVSYRPDAAPKHATSRRHLASRSTGRSLRTATPRRKRPAVLVRTASNRGPHVTGGE